jgi:hypothetical protein
MSRVIGLAAQGLMILVPPLGCGLCWVMSWAGEYGIVCLFRNKTDHGLIGFLLHQCLSWEVPW